MFIYNAKEFQILLTSLQKMFPIQLSYLGGNLFNFILNPVSANKRCLSSFEPRFFRLYPYPKVACFYSKLIQSLERAIKAIKPCLKNSWKKIIDLMQTCRVISLLPVDESQSIDFLNYESVCYKHSRAKIFLS